MQVGSKRTAALAADLVVGGFGAALLVIAILCGRAWAERHIFPAWAWSWPVEIEILLVLRLIVAGLGTLVLLLVRPWVRSKVRAGQGRDALVAAAMALVAAFAGLAAAEAVLRTQSWRSTQERWDQQEPLRARDARIGWTFVPNHSGIVVLGGRRIAYATDSHGYRVRASGAEVDLAKPSIVFAGESILLGYGLPYDETIPARVAAATGFQAANISINAYSTDQSLMRLERELPRFAHPVAVVTIFVPVLVDRNLDRDRPHLGPDLHWIPAEPPPLRLIELVRRVARYRSRESIRDGIAMTQAALRRGIALAKARGAIAIILVPQMGPETDRERAVRKAVLDDAHIPYLRVQTDESWRLKGDRHPDARADRAMAAAIAAAILHRPALANGLQSIEGRSSTRPMPAAPRGLSPPKPIRG